MTSAQRRAYLIGIIVTDPLWELEDEDFVPAPGEIRDLGAEVEKALRHSEPASGGLRTGERLGASRPSPVGVA